jgi:hypothetical protein
MRPSGCGAESTCASARNNPGVSPGTTNAVMPRLPAPGVVTANSTYTSAIPAFEIRCFSPCNTQPSPSRAAVVRIAATSEPASGSVIANAAMASPLTIGASHRSR